MPDPGPHKALDLPEKSAQRRGSWRDSLSRAIGGRPAAAAPSQSTSSLSSDFSSELDSSTASAFSRLSVSTLLGLAGTGKGGKGGGGADRPKAERARSLLRLLLKSQKSTEGSGSELVADVHSLVPCGDVVGLLAVSVKQLKDFTTKFNVKRDTSLLVRISIDKIMKCTNPQVYRANFKSSKKNIAINFGDVRYFSVKVPNKKSDSRNRIVLELVGFENAKDFPRLFGSVTTHLYEVIQRQSFVEVCAMRIRNMVFCMAEVEFMFCYGSLGYGYSHQLKLPGADPVKAVACSMFMRVPPPKDRKDASNVIKPQLLDYPAFLSPDLNVKVGNVDLEAPTEDLVDYETLQKALKEPPRERLVKMKQEYRSLKTWREKAEYLDQLLLKRGPKTKPGVIKISRFRQFVGKMQHPLRQESLSTSGAERVIHEVMREEKQPEFMVDLPDSVSEIPVIQSTISEIPALLRRAETDSDTDSEKDHEFLESADTLHAVPTLTISSTASSHLSSDIIERTVKRVEISPESETSLSSSSGNLAECSDSHVETGDSESTAFESPETKAVEEEPVPTVRKESAIESPQSVEEPCPEPEVSLKFAEVEAPKTSESLDKILPQWPWKEVEFQEPVFRRNKFEPFLRHIRGVQPPALLKGKANESSTFIHLDQKGPYVETKEQEDQDPPQQISPTKAAGSSDSMLVKGGKQLSILRLIEKKIETEEEEPPFPLQIDEEPKALASKPDLSQKQLEKALSDSEVKQVHLSFKRSVEEFLINRLTKVIALKSLLSKQVENLVEERLLEAEVSEELEDSMSTVESLPDARGKFLLMGRKPCSGERLSEQDICNLKTAASQNLQASLMEKLSAHGIIPGRELAENNQKVSVSGSAEGDLLKRKKQLSKERISPTEIVTLKSLSDSQSTGSSQSESVPSRQEDQRVVRETDLSESKTDDRESALRHKSKSSSVEESNTKTGLDKERPKKSLEIIRVRLPVSTETELSKKSPDNIKLSGPEVSPKSDPNKTVNDTLIEKLLKEEIASLKSFLSKGLQEHLKDKLSDTGSSTKEDFEKICQQLSLDVKDELTTTLGKASPEGSQDSSKANLPEICATKQKTMFSKNIQNLVLETLTESEIANLKSVLNKKIHDHLLERLSEIGMITEEELRKVLENFFPVVAKETPPKGNNEKVSFKKGETAHSTTSLTQSLQDRFSEDELKNLKSVLNRLLKEDHRERLSESEIKGLTSVLQKNFKDLPVQSCSETGISKEVEIKDECHNISLPTMDESSPLGFTVNVSEKEKSHSKDSLRKIFSNEKLGLGGKPDPPVNSVFKAEELHKETQTSGFMPPPKKVALKAENPDSSVNSACGVETAQGETQTNFPILPPKKVVLKAENPDSSVNSVCGVETTHGETQTNFPILPPKKVKQSSKKECHRLPGSDKPDMANSKRGYETVLRNQPFNESLMKISDVFTSSSFLSAHDIGVQTELKNYLSRPPGYLSKPTFPVNPQTFLFLHSESEEEAKLPSRLHQKSKSRKKPDKSSKKDILLQHLQQGVTNAQVKKDKPAGGIMSKDVVKEKGRKHCELPAPRLIPADSKKDIKTTASPGVVRKESSKLKFEKKRDEVKPKKSFSKTSVPSDPHLQNLGKNLPDKASVTKFPASWRTTGNTLNIPGTLDLDMETFKHLEKAIERALIDLGKAPEGGLSQALHSARTSAAPGVAATAKELLRSIAASSSAVENPRISASSLSEMPDNQEPILKMSPERLEAVLWILQNILRQNTKSQSNG